MFGQIGAEMGQAGGHDNGWLSKSDGENVGLLKRMQDKVTEINPQQKLVFLHCIIHQEVLCKSLYYTPGSVV